MTAPQGAQNQMNAAQESAGGRNAARRRKARGGRPAKRRAERREVNDCDEAPRQSPRPAKRSRPPQRRGPDGRAKRRQREASDCGEAPRRSPAAGEARPRAAKTRAGRPSEAPRRKAASEAEPRAAKAAKFAISDLQILPCRAFGAAQRAMRASQRGQRSDAAKSVGQTAMRSAAPKGARRMTAASEARPRAAKTPNQKMRNCKSFLAVPSRGRPSAPCARHCAASAASPRIAKSAKFAISDSQILPCRPRWGRPSAPCARHKRGRAKCHREKRGPDGRAKRRAERREVNDCDEAPRQSPRLAKRGREVGDARNLRFYNPTLPRLWHGPARHARVTSDKRFVARDTL